MPQLEADIQRAIQAYLRKRGAWVVKYHGGTYTSKGVPDLLVCWQGRFVAFEVKRPGRGRVSALQEGQIRKIIKAKGIACVVHSVKEVEEVLDELSP